MSNGVAAAVKAAREQRFPTARAFAERIGKDPAWVSKLENGLLKETPTVEDVAAIERELGIAQATFLALWGYDIPERRRPTITDPLLADLVAQWPSLDPHLKRFLKDELATVDPVVRRAQAG